MIDFVRKSSNKVSHTKVISSNKPKLLRDREEDKVGAGGADCTMNIVATRARRTSEVGWTIIK
jgi:hypothetical protein